MGRKSILFRLLPSVYETTNAYKYERNLAVIGCSDPDPLTLTGNALLKALQVEQKATEFSALTEDSKITLHFVLFYWSFVNWNLVSSGSLLFCRIIELLCLFTFIYFWQGSAHAVPTADPFASSDIYCTWCRFHLKIGQVETIAGILHILGTAQPIRLLITHVKHFAGLLLVGRRFPVVTFRIIFWAFLWQHGTDSSLALSCKFHL